VLLGRLARLRAENRRRLEVAAYDLLGPEPADRRTRVMVTLPSEAADDPALVRDLLDAGMDLARINAAHDGPDAWRSMAAHVRAASEASGRPCRILIDLPGPKLRIAGLPDRRSRLRIRRPADGAAPSPLLLDGSGRPGATTTQDGEAPRVSVDASWLARLVTGDVVHLVDARGRERSLRVERRTSSGQVLVTVTRGIVIETGTVLVHHAAAGPAGDGGSDGATTQVGPFEPAPGSVVVKTGDRLRLVAASPATGELPATPSPDVETEDLPTIGCPLPEAVAALQPGHRVIIDDGHVVTRVETVDATGVILAVIATRRPTERLRTDEGLNLPDSTISLRAVNPDDLVALDVAVSVADLVGVSFAQDVGDVDRVVAYLEERGDRRLGLVVKIENRRGVEGLPDLIVAGATRRPFGVMIARGDLAVEIGYERLAEIQEQLLWVCEAAHVPAIWATQVLESMVKTGVPTRAELTDAAMGQRAECVMLNKGPFIVEGMETLIDVLRRMDDHQRKKTPLLRALGSW
jgi:pyruvate kinase